MKGRRRGKKGKEEKKREQGERSREKKREQERTREKKGKEGRRREKKGKEGRSREKKGDQEKTNNKGHAFSMVCAILQEHSRFSPKDDGALEGASVGPVFRCLGLHTHGQTDKGTEGKERHGAKVRLASLHEPLCLVCR